MKKFGCIALMMLLMTGMLAGCGEASFEADTSTIYVEKNGKVTSIDVEELDQNYYDEAELESFVKEAVDAYTAEHGKGTVEITDLTVTEGIAKLKMQYETAEDYTTFNGIELYQDTVVKALAAGYGFDVAFAKVENGSVVGAATKEDIYAEDDLKVAIIKANTNLQVSGEILFVSCDNVKLTGSNSVSIREEYEIDKFWDNEAQESVLETESVFNTEEASNTEGAIETESVSDTESTLTENFLTGDSFETEVYTYVLYK